MAVNRGFEYREHIGRRGTGLTVLAHLCGTYRHSSEDAWRHRLDGGLVLLDGKPARPDDVLRCGQELIWRRPPWNEPDVPLAFAVLHLDEHLLAVAKPGGLPTVPAGGFLEHTLLMLVRKFYPEAVPIHRLGRGTSGIVLFARTRHARSALTKALRHGGIRKTYRALASGIPDKEEFTIDVPIGPVPHPVLGTLHAASPMGKPALSRARVIERRHEATLLEVRIQTGKPHQIRIHLAAAGYPLVGDPLFVSGGGFKDGGNALPGDTGYFLHAECIRLPHPANDAPVAIYCRPPPVLREHAPQISRCARNDSKVQP